MRFSSWAAFAGLAAFATGAAAERMLVSNSLNPCLEDSKFTASLFKLYFNPDNRSATVDLVAVSSIEGMVRFDIDVFAYGLSIVNLKINPCEMGLNGFCPMNAGPLQLPILVGPKDISEDAIKNIPSIAYDFPDLDATIRINVVSTDTGKAVACMEADISNGKTVNLVGVKWAIAIIAGLVLISSGIINGLGHTNAATHIASGALSLFGFFQTQALLGLTAVHLPPVVQSWTQDFQWSIGIVKVDFMQNIFTWYQRATGGTPSTLFNDLTTVSVRAMKRSLPEIAEFAEGAIKRAVTVLPRVASLVRRDDAEAKAASYVIYGVQRVAFREGIEPTNLFITGFTSFYLFVLFTLILVVAFKGFCELAVKAGWMKPTSFEEFRTTWTTFLRGILYRLTFLGYPSMTVLCFWELTRNDSPAEMVLAVMFLLSMTASLAWASYKIFGITRRSIAMHRNPAYILFTDERVLNKWGFLYVQFRASAYYYIGPVLLYILVKSMFVALAQSSGITQAIGLLIIEAAALVAASVLRPWMDKSTNSFNIAICAINFINAIFLLMFADVFGQPAIVNGVIGLVLFLMNAIFALVLLLMLIITTIIIFVRKNPDSRYQFMADDRASFMKSQSQLTGTTELDALAATARGDKAGYKLDLDQDDTASMTGSLRQRPNYSSNNLPMGAGNSSRNLAQPPRSPVHPSTSLLPADIHPANPYNDSFRSQNNSSPASFRNQGRTASPWQRGAGYE